MNCRPATTADAPLLAVFNHQLIQDEGHRNRMSVAELEQRMKGWLEGEYRAVICESDGEVVGYALYREQESDIYFRQLFIARDRRRQGHGRRMVEILRARIWPPGKRVAVEVLVGNEPALAFWRAVGFSDYSLTLEQRSNT